MLEIKKQKKNQKNKQTNKHYIVLNLEVCGISSVGGKGLVVDWQRRSDGDNLIFALTIATFEILFNIIS